MAKYIELTEELQLAMIASARAIENTPKYHGTIFVKDFMSDNPREIPYLQAARVLREKSELPPADVAPVRKGYWRKFVRTRYCGISKDGNPICRNSYIYCCSNCDRRTIIRERYCPHCGSKMDGGIEGA